MTVTVELDLLVRILISAFALRWAAIAITELDGPFDLFSRSRARAQRVTFGDGFLFKLLTCPICLGFWLAIPLTLAALYMDFIPFFLIVAPFGIAGLGLFDHLKPLE